MFCVITARMQGNTSSRDAICFSDSSSIIIGDKTERGDWAIDSRTTRSLQKWNRFDNEESRSSRTLNSYLHHKSGGSAAYPVALNSWDLDIRLYSSMELVHLASAILIKKKVHLWLKISSDKLYFFCQEVQKQYKKVPYHNFSHGLMSMHICSRLLSAMDSLSQSRERMSSLYRLGLLIAALCHDINHDGKTNLFHRNTRSEIWMEYSDISTLERLHTAYTLRLIKTTGIFKNVKKKTGLKKIINDLILATDLKYHKELLIDSKEEDHLCKLMLHCSDISYPTLNTNLSQYWARLVLKEFQIQLREEEQQMTVGTILTDEPKHGSAAEADLHLGFIKTFAKPAWKALEKQISHPTIEDCLKYIKENQLYWERQRKERNGKE